MGRIDQQAPLRRRSAALGQSTSTGPDAIICVVRHSRPKSARRRRRRKPNWSTDEFIAGTLTLALAVAGGVAYLLVPTTKMWWIGQLAVAPLLWFVIARGERLKQRPRDGDHFGSNDGPWWSP
jgi:hypothetical protein